MASAQAGRGVAYVLAALGLFLATAPNAQAIEALDGRLQAHGFLEAQVRALDRDFAEEIDLSQWYNVFNLELEADILPDGWGPFDLLSAYVRAEFRYDAVYNNGMWMFPSVSTYGDSSKRLPLRLRDALDQDYGGTVNANAQANPPGSNILRVPDAGDLNDPDVARYQHPRGAAGAPLYHERDPVGWAIEAVVEGERLDFARDANGMFIPDPKNPVDPDDLVFVYRTSKSNVLLANLTDAELAQYALPVSQGGLGDTALLQQVSVVVLELDDNGDEVLALNPQGAPIVACGTERLPSLGGGLIECRALPGSGPANRVLPGSPPTPGGPATNQAGPDPERYHMLLDLGRTQVTDPLTGETATVAELYGDVRFELDVDGNPVVDANGNLVPATVPRFPQGLGNTGLGPRIQGAATIVPSPTGVPTGPTLPVLEDPDDPNSDNVGGDGLLVGFNVTCPTNRRDTRNAYATDFTGAFEYDQTTRQEILASGREGSCLDNRPQEIDIVNRRAFPGFDTLFEQEGADGELGVNPDAADPVLTNRSSPVSDLRETMNSKLIAAGFPSIEDGGLNGNPALDVPGYQVEQDILRDVATYYRGIARVRDDPAFYALEPVIDWRFTTREVKGSEGGNGGTALMGPWLPKNFFETLATLENRANPFRGRETPTLVARTPSSDVPGYLAADAPGERAPQNARAVGDRYSDLDVAAMQREIAEKDFIVQGTVLSRYITDEACPPGPPGAGCKVIETVPDPDNPGLTIQAITALDLSNATFGPDPVDPGLQRVDEITTLVGEAGLRLRVNRDRGSNSPTPQQSQASTGPYPNDILQSSDTQTRFRFNIVGTAQIFDVDLLQRSGTTVGGDWSGILPCVNTLRDVTRTGPPVFDLERRLAGNLFGVTEGTALGCVPYTNVSTVGGGGELPLRPAADMSNLMRGLEFDTARGNFIPSQGLIRAVQNLDFDDPQFNISELDRSLNHGASQSDTYELKEAYVDMEFLDSRLWIRAGLQNIVWGKTELFRTTDQFNPQDFALSSLPSLEESRIAVLSGRAVYSLYDVGPLEDVRLEFAANFDRVKPTDLGACGEPYTLDIVCSLTVGLAAHGLTGIGVAGVDRPPNAWDDIDGMEFGGRVEFRWDRFSFAIVDFYGYSDFPYPYEIMSYFKEVDTGSGRLIKAFGSGPCENAAGFVDRVEVRNNANAPQQYQTWSAGNRRLAQEVVFGDVRRATLTPQGDPTALPTGADTPTALDDWVKHPLAYTIQGIGIDPGCLKPGGIAGKPNENRFDPDLAPDQPLELVRADPDDPSSAVIGIDADGDGVVDFTQFASTSFASSSDSFNNSTFGQWLLEGSSVDNALEWHPHNQQLFSLICLGTVSIVAALDPGACAWSLFGSGAPLIPGVLDAPLSEVLTVNLAGDTSDNTISFQSAFIQATKGTENEFENVYPLVSLNRDARDGLTTAVDGIITGNDPFNPGDLGDLLTLGNTLTAEQQALFGCGPFYGTRCDSGSFYNSEFEAASRTRFQTDNRCPGPNCPGNALNRLPPPARPSPRNRVLPGQQPFISPVDSQALEFPTGNAGIDVLNAEGSVILQSIPGVEGTAEPRGTYTRLVRDDDGELLRAGSGGSIDGIPVDVADVYGVDPNLLNADRTRFIVPDAYADLFEDSDPLTNDLASLNEGLAILQDNDTSGEVDGGFRLGCPAPPGIIDPTCAGLDQISAEIARLNQLFLDGSITPQENTLRLQLTTGTGGGQYTRQFNRINTGATSQTTMIRNQENAITSASRDLLATFLIGGDPNTGVDRSAFGRPRQAYEDTETGEPCDPDDPDPEDTCQLVEVPLAGNVVDGLEEFGPINNHVTWSNAPQPGTLGNAGLVQRTRTLVPGAIDPATGQFETILDEDNSEVIEDPNPFVGGATCTRYDPASPFADKNGIVILPGCRGALNVSVNTTPPPGFLATNVYNIDEDFDGTVEVEFEDFYDPRVDGCTFGPTMNARDGSVYKVQAVLANGEQDNYTQALLETTCFNRSLSGVQSTTQFPNTPFEFEAIDPDTDLDSFGNPILLLNGDGTTNFNASTHRRRQNELLEYTNTGGGSLDTVAAAFARTLFHPWASCLQSSALFGAQTTGLSFALQNAGNAVSRSRPWAVDGAAPFTQRLPQTRGVAIIPQEVNGENVFGVDAGVAVNTQEAASVTPAAGTRASFLCDIRTRDLENDFFEGVLKQDLDGDGLVASGAQVFRSEVAAVSWNSLMFLTITSCNASSGGDDLADADCYRPSTPWAIDRCSLSTPQFCRNVKGFLSVAGLRRQDYRAGGNGSFGRRDFIWQSGAEVMLRYKRRNVFGVSADFAEDFTKTNWGMEFTWIGPQPYFDNDSLDSTTSSNTLNLTISVDRPTFINFLNPNRTFFMNTQWFFQYIPDYSSSFFSSGPFNALFTFAIFTGYYQDRFLPQVVTVYDFRSNSGGFLPQISYRFNEAFSITFGVSFFIGRSERIVMPVRGIAPTQNRAGPHAYQDSTERLLSNFRARDEAFMRIRWTF